MIHPPDPPVRALRSLPLAILLGTALSAIGWPAVKWLALLIFREPVPPWPVWTDYLVIRAIAGVCLGAAAYAAGRLPTGWLRMCLYWTLFFILIEGDVDDFARWSLEQWLSTWLVGGLIIGVIFGSVYHALERRDRRRAGMQPAPRA